MADCDCQYCHREEYCPVVYEGYNCRINAIKAAKAVVDDAFKASAVVSVVGKSG